MPLKAGDWVEVRSTAEILRSLDESGRLENLPFMPQMLGYCGQRFKVYKRAHKTCDTVNPIAGRRLANTVHLELRCDGQAYGGCEASCLIFWKEAWLRPVNGVGDGHLPDEPTGKKSCTEKIVWRSTCASDAQSKDGKRYFCQATELPRFTKPLKWWDIRQYLEDYTSRNVTLARIAKSFAFKVYYLCLQKSGNRLGPILMRFYDWLQSMHHGTPFPIRRGTIPAGQETPVSKLDLQAGEWVRVKDLGEILATYDTNYKNRGMIFDKEMVPFCGGTYRVLRRINRLINEKTGRMQEMKTPAVILDSVFCQGRYSECRLFCPRAIFPFWREVWLERVEPPAPRLSKMGPVSGSIETSARNRSVGG